LVRHLVLMAMGRDDDTSGHAGGARRSSLAERVQARERRAIAQALTEVERQSPEARALLHTLRPVLGRALTVGVTGPPGAGKSTLVDATVRVLRAAGRTVGVIAVDPSSPISGGAILGDRIRMTSALDDDGVFVRSLAARGHLGGLTPAAVRMIDILDAAGFDIVLLETVGTGQSEIDIAEVTDVRVVVSAPGLGDDIQAMKAGLLEIADVLVVNKADRDGAERTLHQLLAAAAIRSAARTSAPVLKTTATSGDGVDALVAAIDRIGDARLAEGRQARRRRRARYLIARAAADLVAAEIRQAATGRIEALSDAVLDGSLTAAEAATHLIKQHAAADDAVPPLDGRDTPA
jgi:LAO/AO transport system kinase